MCLFSNDRVRRVSRIAQGVSQLRTHFGNLSLDGSDSSCADRRLIIVRKSGENKRWGGNQCRELRKKGSQRWEWRTQSGHTWRR